MNVPALQNSYPMYSTTMTNYTPLPVNCTGLDQKLTVLTRELDKAKRSNATMYDLLKKQDALRNKLKYGFPPNPPENQLINKNITDIDSRIKKHQSRAGRIPNLKKRVTNLSKKVASCKNQTILTTLAITSSRVASTTPLPTQMPFSSSDDIENPLADSDETTQTRAILKTTNKSVEPSFTQTTSSPPTTMTRFSKVVPFTSKPKPRKMKASILNTNECQPEKNERNSLFLALLVSSTVNLLLFTGILCWTVYRCYKKSHQKPQRQGHLFFPLGEP